MSHVLTPRWTAVVMRLDAGPAGLGIITPDERGDADDVADPAYALTATGHETVRDALAGGASASKEESCRTS
ncbi:hypothetical protein [Actinoallomurus iriomotensis]|uniref:Uncharacterized protein n=1 Tax=Actinoallomurus iriomotensis TaxID=478107 RepID=A0A9W6VWT2_9ACTN|nr:hypothetical protein [Actinoallomurus iriomotensis]GLY81907.1 hypothetical protein Airi01_101740 [Actinoallomurus iriomotensis]